MARNKKQGDKYNAPFAVSLRKLLDDRNATQGDIAAVTGLTRQTVSQYCNGISEPGYDTLVKIADYFDVSIDYLLGRTGDPNRQASAIDDLGLSLDAVETLEFYRSKSETGSFINGVNMLLSASYILPIADSITALAHSVDLEKKRMHQYMLDRFGNTKIPMPGYSFVEEQTRKLTTEIQSTIVECHPELEGRIFVQCGVNALDARMQDILTLFESAVRSVTGYSDFMCGDIDELCDSYEG